MLEVLVVKGVVHLFRNVAMRGDIAHRVCMAELYHYIKLVLAATSGRMVSVHGVATGKRGNVGLVVGVAKYIQVVKLDYFKVVFEVPSIFQRVKKSEKNFECYLAV